MHPGDGLQGNGAARDTNPLDTLLDLIRQVDFWFIQSRYEIQEPLPGEHSDCIVSKAENSVYNRTVSVFCARRHEQYLLEGIGGVRARHELAW